MNVPTANVIEIVRGSIYLAACAKEGVADLKTVLSSHILQCSKRHRVPLRSTPLSTSSHIHTRDNLGVGALGGISSKSPLMGGNWMPQTPQFTPKFLPRLAESNECKTEEIQEEKEKEKEKGNEKETIATDGNVNRAPQHANRINPGIYTPGFTVALLPSFMSPKQSIRPLSSVFCF